MIVRECTHGLITACKGQVGQRGCIANAQTRGYTQSRESSLSKKHEQTSKALTTTSDSTTIVSICGHLFCLQCCWSMVVGNVDPVFSMRSSIFILAWEMDDVFDDVKYPGDNRGLVYFLCQKRLAASWWRIRMQPTRKAWSRRRQEYGKSRYTFLPDFQGKGWRTGDRGFMDVVQIILQIFFTF